MEVDLLKIYKDLKEITQYVYENIVKDIKPESSAKEIVEKWEQYIRSKGFEPAFPINLSVNEVAAHMSPGLDYDYTLHEGDVVKVDFGVQKQGYCTDVAQTIVVGDGKPEEARYLEEAVEEAIKKIAPGVDVMEISNTIAEVLESYELNPIRELGGHMIERYELHGSIFVPTYRVQKPIYVFQPGDVFAIEVFGTHGAGRIEPKGHAHIFSINEARIAYARAGKDVLMKFYSKYKALPFSDRWEEYLFRHRRVTIRQLTRKGFIIDYPPLVEKSRSLVYQAEKTVVIGEDSVLVVP
jgi:methionyl aminopeptidase